LGTLFALFWSSQFAITQGAMMDPAMILPMAAAGWAFLVWLFGGGLGLALIVFIVLKLIGQ
jgi:hypothetical protein